MGTYKGSLQWLVVTVLWITVAQCQGKVHYKVKCTEDAMLVELVRTSEMGDIYLEQLQHYPDPACHPVLEDNKATFRLSLSDIFQCGVTRVANQLTGRRVFYHRVVVEGKRGEAPAKQVVLVKCVLADHPEDDHQEHSVVRRDVLPAGFQEPEFLEITTNLTGQAPEPMLGVAVRQGGQLVTGELNVNPGTPLQMEIYLDKGSAPIYGLLVSYMQVTDTKQQEETIISKGCSVDPYLFENFVTTDGDSLAAKFRAFKFPESTFVQFKGTVSVCLDKCAGKDCSNGQTGYGRRRREVGAISADPNKVFEVTMTTFIKVEYTDDKSLEKGKINAPSLNVPDDVNNHVNDKQQNQHLKLETEEIREELEYTVYDQAAASGVTLRPIFASLALAIVALVLRY